MDSSYQESNFNDAIVVDLKDFISQMLHKAVWIILAVIVGALLGGVAYFYARHAAVTPAEQVEKTRSKLTESSILKAEKQYQQYLVYLNSKDILADYINHSLFMKIDPLRVPTRTISYLLSTNYAAEADVLSTMSLTEDDYLSIAEQLGDKNLSPYISELINMRTNAYITGIAMSGEGDDLGGIQKVTTNQDVCLTVKIVADTKAHTELIWNVVETALAREVEVLNIEDPDLKLVQIGDVYTVTADNGVQTLQTNKADELSTITTSLGQLSNSSNLSSDEKAYYDAMVAQKEEPNQQKNVSLVKYTTIGVGISLFVLVLFLFLNYTLSGKIQSAENLKAEGVEIIQRISLVETPSIKLKNNSGVNALSIYNKEELTLALLKIEALCNSSNANSIYIITEANIELPNNLLDSIIKEFNNREIKALYGMPFVQSLAFQELLHSDGVVFLVVLHKSRQKNVRDAVNLCKKYGINFLGSLVVDNT